MPLPGGHQEGVIAGPIFPEAKIIADDQGPYREFIDQDLPHKLSGRERRERRVEPQAHHAVDPAPLKLRYLLTQIRKARRRLMRREKLDRLRFKDQRAGDHMAGAGAGLQLREHGLMAQMHAVKIADGSDAGPFLPA